MLLNNCPAGSSLRVLHPVFSNGHPIDSAKPTKKGNPPPVLPPDTGKSEARHL